MAPLLPELPEPVPIIGDLIPHPEGGAYRERFRSTEMLAHPRGRGKRSALTLIHFCLQEGEVSAWHRVESDELWLYAGGDGVELWLWDGTGAPVRRRLGAEGRESQTWQAVPADHWQAARPLGPRALLHCVVAPGFDFADFTLLRDGPQPLLEALQRLDPAAGKYL
ncbi:MAG: cupin domain-containing protein [Planctomycetota bacterium]|nr:MAG: cupin domain-containing protein [Planctomycetota bacterium]